MDAMTWDDLMDIRPITEEEERRGAYADARARTVTGAREGRKLFHAHMKTGEWVRRERPDLGRIFWRELATFERVMGLDRF